MAGFDIEKVPAWAYNWCYYFGAIGILSLLTAVSTLFFSRQLGAFTILYMLGGLAQAATAMTLFWMCRTSLRTTDAAHYAVKGL